MRHVVVAAEDSESIKFTGKVENIKFEGEYEVGPEGDVVNILVYQEFPKLNTKEDVYTILALEFEVEDYDSLEDCIEHAKDMIEVAFKDIGCKGDWE